MTDEKYAFFEDLREKNSTKSGAFHKRTHCGKGGAVRLPSDNLSKKELKAMNGECKTYRMNEPMKWDEFKVMPDDLKVSYVKSIRAKFPGVPDNAIAEMFGIDRQTVGRWFRCLGLGLGKKAGGKKRYDAERWIAWCNGAPLPAADSVEASPDEPTVAHEDFAENQASAESVAPVPEPIQEEKRKEPRFATPKFGTMSIEGRTEECLNTIAALLGNANICLSISWEVRHNDGECENG